MNAHSIAIFVAGERFSQTMYLCNIHYVPRFYDQILNSQCGPTKSTPTLILDVIYEHSLS